jgi:hypothetical protein
MARLIPLEDDDGSFDREFWDKIGHEGRFAAMWDMVMDAARIRGEDVNQLRLQRSVLRIRHA